MTSETLTRAGSTRPKSFNASDNTVAVVFTTGATVRRHSPRDGAFDEELVVDGGSVRLGRLNAGAAVLDTHHDADLRNIIGSVVPGSARIDAGIGVATVQLSRRDELRGLVQDIRDGVIRNVSVGYRYHKVERIPGRDGSVPVMRVSDWEPLEISFVPVPADPGAMVRSEPAPAPLSLPSAPKKDHAMTTGARRAAAITAALLHRSDPENFPMTSEARDFAGLTLGEIAAELLSAEGVSTRRMKRAEIIDLALAGGTRAGLHSTSDFSTILADVGSKSLRRAYEAAPQTWRPFTRETTISDFKPVSRSQMSEAPQLEKVNEHGEFRRGTMGEAKESYQLLTYGKVVGITRQAIINDDLGAFTRIAAAFGVQAANLEGDLVWAQIVGNPTMGDGVALFHANHANLGTAGGISATTVAEGYTAMRLQKGLDGRTLLNLTPSFLITSVAAQVVAQQFLASTTPAMVAAQTSNVVPAYLRALAPISEPRLDGGFTNPATGVAIAGNDFHWFMAGDKNQNDTVEIAYLEGEHGVQTTTRRGFDVDGVEVKVRLDVGAKTIDWRSFFKNPATAL